MSAPHESSGHILVGVDESDDARAALVWALGAAAARGAELTVLAAFPVDLYWADPLLLDGGRIDAVRRHTEERVAALVADARRDPAVVAAGAGDVPVRIRVEPGPAAARLVHRCQGADLLVVGNRGRGAVRSTVAGSVALHCAAHAPCPVVVVHRGGADDQPARIVVGLDDSEAARAALGAALEMAGRWQARVDAVLAYEIAPFWGNVDEALAPPPEELGKQATERAEAIVADVVGAREGGRPPVRVVAVPGHPVDVLVREAAGARLLVVGSRSRSPLHGLVMGSTALHCVMRSPSPVLVVHGWDDVDALRRSTAGEAAVVP
jgi:nucleotide-binding universal stress UspA family protein